MRIMNTIIITATINSSVKTSYVANGTANAVAHLKINDFTHLQIEAWGKVAEELSKLKVGMSVLIVGELHHLTIKASTIKNLN